MNKNNFFFTVIFTFAASFFFVFFLSLADSLTAEKTAANTKMSFYAAFLKSAGIDYEDKYETEKLFQKNFPAVAERVQDDTGEFAKTIKTTVNGEELVLKLFSGSGLWGTITGVIAVTPDLKTIKGLEIISHNETPGLGGRIDEQWFKEQFAGEAIASDDAAVKVRKGSGGSDNDPSNSEVEGITGASLTSASIQTIVNNVISGLAKEGI
ncbi:MAG: FMN-binding protein [Spirochaetia bacterium]|jgi:Na+-transporting NADH:ubiquinone oxidoreductase subunit C|nr:FMN-binding protein [Spirochaetia bacterium]